MSGAQESKEQREKRLADALRANLRRRKDQARERREPNAEPTRAQPEE